MTLDKHRKYTTSPATNLALVSAPPSAPKNVAHHVAPVGTTDSFLRLRCEFHMDVRIGGTDIPPESWWPATTVTLVAFYTDTNSTTVGNSVGSSRNYLGSQLLVPRMIPSASTPGDYIVTWSQTEPLLTDTARKPALGATGPAINIGLVVYDFTPALDGTYADLAIDYECRLFTLWGSVP